MSELMPEVGDVWEIYGKMYLVLTADQTTVDVLFNRFTYDTKSFLTKEFVKAAVYIGKSKSNINQLFEVQDDCC